MQFLIRDKKTLKQFNVLPVYVDFMRSGTVVILRNNAEVRMNMRFFDIYPDGKWMDLRYAVTEGFTLREYNLKVPHSKKPKSFEP